MTAKITEPAGEGRSDALTPFLFVQKYRLGDTFAHKQ
jgi:hypothetical protein